jgi:dUTP pyrophosphatase
MAGCSCVRELEIKVLYHNEKLTRIQAINIGDWTDLRCAEEIELKAGEFRFIDLGISVEVPKGYEMHIAPRGSTFKNFGLLQVNSVGVLDESYSGDTDIVKMPALAMRDTKIGFDDRICQCRLVPKQPNLTWVTVKTLDNDARGGFGSTGTNEFTGNAKVIE